ncbi:MAG: hypothetical protein QXO86_07550 [Nitrososphaerota archaeon]
MRKLREEKMRVLLFFYNNILEWRRKRLSWEEIAKVINLSVIRRPESFGIKEVPRRGPFRAEEVKKFVAEVRRIDRATEGMFTRQWREDLAKEFGEGSQSGPAPCPPEASGGHGAGTPGDLGVKADGVPQDQG